MFDRVDCGMSRDTVDDILGGPGRERSEVSAGGYDCAVYDWTNSDGSKVLVEFENGTVVGKGQARLP
jgi:hypothetical protein